jgi:hypothetical protein
MILFDLSEDMDMLVFSAQIVVSYSVNISIHIN